MKNGQHTKKGFTLIEALAGIVIIGILAAAIAMPLNMGARAYVTGQSLMRSQEIGRVALWRIERDLRKLRKGNLTVADTSTLTFTDAYQDSITFSFSGGQLLKNGFLLADSVSAITFTYYDSTNTVLSPLPLSLTNRANVYMIRMFLILTVGGESYNFEEQIFPRDLRF
ncbi:MAG: prepilin-type N-terminal cleavage/methylation domain-containing protein [Chlamydiae bacterium]|nr:prepilin-type N-terminal cleavage/methylation domain-containing protein [Chlamydiota bacterium]MBI3266597.1 prepilin-type N-terminal cleavage/methylation domain-containing protein [Chlamydiota bacterium]